MQFRTCPSVGNRPGALRVPRRGFTLIEILTATAIMALLVSLVMTILSQVVSAWNRSSDELEIGAKARQALDTLTQDLQTAIFRSDGSQWLSCTTEPTPNSPVSGVNTTRLIFYTTSALHQTKDDGTTGHAGNSIYGDVSAIEYRVAYADPFGNPTSSQQTFSLHRVTVDPGSTFFGVNGKPMMGIYSGGPGGVSHLEDEFDAVLDTFPNGVASSMQGVAGTTLRVTLYGSSAHESILLDNVARFDVFLFYYGSNPVAGAAPATQVYPETTPNDVNPAKYYFGGWARSGSSPSPANQPGYLDLISSSSGGGASPTFIRVAFADVTMTVLTDEGVALLNTFQGAMPEALTWQDFLDQYGKTYTQRIQFFNSP